MLSEGSPEAALARGAHALVELTGAEVAGLLLVQGGACSHEFWHPDEPAVRERWGPAFRAAALGVCEPASAGQAPPEAEGPTLTVIPLLAAGRRLGLACLAGACPTASESGPAPWLTGGLASIAGTRREAARAAAARRDYERWFQVRADRGQLEQVLMNLALNARDAMPGGGLLTIEVAAADADERGERGAAGRGPCAAVRVSDTGCGMDAATAARIFEPFFTTKGQGKGPGLGLSTVYGIVEQNGGHIEVESRPGVGSTFTVYLPCIEAETGVQAGERPSFDSLRGRETVLLVEDEPAVRAMAREALEQHGYAVLEARGGMEALEMARAHGGPIHLLITDVVMPLMGGGELARRMRAARPGLQVLYMSGYTDDAVVRHGVFESTSAFLQKPFSIAAFAHKVRQILDSSAADEGQEPPATRAA